MAQSFDEIPIDEVAEGDIVDDPGPAANGQSAKVVHKDMTTSEAGGEAVLVVFETDNGETFEVEYPSGTTVRRFPESKWESAQSPTPHTPVSE